MIKNNKKNKIIGILSDTHGHLSQSAIKALMGVSLILHAGDFNTHKTYRQLQEIAPLKGVLGNTDQGKLQRILPISEVVQIGKTNIYMLHDLDEIEIKPEVAGIHVVIFGHTHRPKISNKNGVLYINPGSASAPRHGGAPSLIRMTISGKQIKTELVDLN